MRRVSHALLLMLALGGAVLAGCSEAESQRPRADGAASAPMVMAPPSPPSARTVAAFRADPAALDEALRRCRNDPGGLGRTPDCLNAAEAGRQRTADEMKQALQ